MDNASSRQSLLDVVIDEYLQDSDRRASRILLTADYFSEKISPEEIHRLHTDFFQAQSQSHPNLKVTGLFVSIANSVICHILEAPTDVLLAYLRMLSQKATGLLAHTKIGAFKEEVPREFPMWAFRNIKNAVEEDFAPPKDYLKVVFNTLKSFLEIGRESQLMSEEKARDYLISSQNRQFMSKMPSVAKIQSFAMCDEMCSVDEFLQIYDTPIEFTLDSEKVWPVEPFLQY